MTTRADQLLGVPFTLGLSAGFFGFYAHAGVIRALHERELAPVAVAGASAGALVGGLWASGTPVETLVERLLNIERAEFWDPAPGAGLLRGQRFDQVLDELMPDRSFAAARVPVTISAFDIARRSTVTLRTGDLALAIRASCSFPGLFHPVRVEGRWLSDGGILDRAGLAGVPTGTRVVHHHLSSRSPWRRRGSAALAAPVRPGLTALVVDGLPRVNPFRLERGRVAYSRAYDAAQRWLDEPVDEAGA